MFHVIHQRGFFEVTSLAYRWLSARKTQGSYVCIVLTHRYGREMQTTDRKIHENVPSYQYREYHYGDTAILRYEISR